MSVSLSNISHSFGGLKVLNSLSLQVMPNAVHILIGSSGCGKTTLLQIIGGLITPDQGEVARGKPSTRSSLQKAAFVFQTPTLVPWLTVGKNIDLILKPHPLSRQERIHRVQQSLAQVQLDSFEHTYPEQLSGGMQQRAALARAIAVNPELLLLDEPFSGLDAMSRRLLGEELILNRKNPATCIMVTHSLEEACLLGDYIHILSARPGNLIQSIENPIPSKHRLSSDSRSQLALLQETLWQHLRDAAAGALLTGEAK